MPRARMIAPRAGTAAQWATADAAAAPGVALALNELGYITDTDIFVMGDGVTAVASLPTAGSGGGSTGQQIGTGQGTLPRWLPYANTAVMASTQNAAFQHIRAVRTQTINSIRTFTATTAAGATPTVCKVGLYSMAANGDITRIGISANTTSLWATANTAYTTALLAGAPVVAGQDYMVAMLIVTAAAFPTHVGIVQLSTATGFHTGYINEYPQFAGFATGQTDLATSYLAANIDAAFTRNFYALLLP